MGLPDDYEGGQRLVLITDLGVVAKRGDTDLLVFVASYSNLASVSGATVRVLSDQNQEIVRGTTDAPGFSRPRSPGGRREKPPLPHHRGKGQRFQLPPLRLLPHRHHRHGRGRRVLPTTGYTAFLYGERDIYRPGETLNGMAMVRDTTLGTPAPMPLTLRQIDPQGRKLGDTVVKTDPSGMAPITLPLPSYLVTGPYVLELQAGDRQIGEYRFQVEDFVPDRIGVAGKPAQPEALPGQKLGYTVTSRYLFGAPASDLPVETRVRLTKAAFTPKGFENYTFGDPERSFEDTEFFQADENLDAEGARTFETALPENVRPRRPWRRLSPPGCARAAAGE